MTGDMEDDIGALFERVATQERRAAARDMARGQAALAIACWAERAANYRAAGTAAAIEALDGAIKKLSDAQDSLNNLPAEAHSEIRRQLAEWPDAHVIDFRSDAVERVRRRIAVENALKRHEARSRFRTELLPGSDRAGELEDSLMELHRALHRARCDLAAGKHQPAPKGRPKKEMAEAFTIMAGETFTYLTGKPATRAIESNSEHHHPYSEFDGFLNELSDIAGTKAHPHEGVDAQVKKYRKWKKSRAPHPYGKKSRISHP